MSSLMAISFLCNLGPVWYHPTILSLAEISKDDSYKIMEHARSTSVYKTLTINFFEHAIHVLQVVVIQEPHRVIPVIFIKWYWGGSEGMEIRAKTMIALQQPTAIITLLKPTLLSFISNTWGPQRKGFKTYSILKILISISEIAGNFTKMRQDANITHLFVSFPTKCCQHHLPAKLFETSRTFFCHDPRSTPTTRFWLPTFPILDFEL